MCIHKHCITTFILPFKVVVHPQQSNEKRQRTHTVDNNRCGICLFEDFSFALKNTNRDDMDIL